MEYLLKLKARMEEISGMWNGDESGLAEDRAHIADEIIAEVDKLIELLKELEETN
jgi:hypothetical protein